MFHVIDLPCEVDLSKAKASFSDGRLEVVMPKAAPAKSVRVETDPGLSAEGDTFVHGTGETRAVGSTPVVIRANEPNVKTQTASSRR